MKQYKAECFEIKILPINLFQLIFAVFSDSNTLQGHIVHYNSDLFHDAGAAASADNGLCVLGMFMKVSFLFIVLQ